MKVKQVNPPKRRFVENESYSKSQNTRKVRLRENSEVETEKRGIGTPPTLLFKIHTI